MSDLDKKILSILNQILEVELAGVVRYTHYSLMVFGYTRIPIVSWLRSQATERLGHAHRAGELITQLGGHPSLGIGDLLETHNHDVKDILQESLKHEKAGLLLYANLLKLVKDNDHYVFIEEFARGLIMEEEMHIGDVEKMLRKPGE